MANVQLIMELLAVDLASEHMRRAAEGMHEMGFAGQAAGLAMGAMAIAVAGVGVGIGESIHAAAEYETSFTKIAALTNATAQDLTAYRGAIEDVGATTGKSAKELSDAMFFIASAGLTGADAIATLDASAKASASGLGETKVVADAVTSALNAYKLSGESASHITDILTNAVVQGKSSADAFAPSLGRVLPVAAAAGVNFEQVAASMATMTRVGLNADEAATALRGTLGALEKPGTAAQKALHEIGLSAGEVRAEIRDKGLLITLGDLMDRTGGNLDVLGKIIPNIRALTGVLATAGSQGEVYAQILESMSEAEGKTDSAFQKTTQTFNFQMGLLHQRFEEMFIDIGQKLLPSLTPFVAMLATEIPKATAILRQALDGDVLGALDAVGAAIGAAVPDIKDRLGEWAQAFLDWIGPLIPPFLGALADLAGQLLGWIADRLPDLMGKLGEWGAAFVDWVKPRIAPLLADLGAMLASVTQWIVDPAAPSLKDALVSWAKEFGAWVAPQIGPTLLELGKLHLRVAGWIFDRHVDLAKSLLTWAQAFGEWVPEGLPALMGNLFSLVGTVNRWILVDALPLIVGSLVGWGVAFYRWVTEVAIPALPGALAGILAAIGAWVQGVLPSVSGQGASIGAALVGGLQGAVSSAAAGIANNAAAAVRNAVTAAAAAAGAAPSPAQRIPGYAGGTDYAPGGAAWVGEQGPELLYLPMGSRVVPTDRATATAGSSVGAVISGDIVLKLDSQVIARVTREQLLQLGRRNGNAFGTLGVAGIT